MKLEPIILKTGDYLGHIIATSLGANALYNVYKGINTGDESYYQLALLETTLSISIELSKYFNRQMGRRIERFNQFIREERLKYPYDFNDHLSYNGED